MPDDKQEQSKFASKAIRTRPGEPGQPSIEEWHDEIVRDLKVALAKMNLLDPTKLQPHMQRTMRQIEVTLASM